jgi:hypothetical protein
MLAGLIYLALLFLLMLNVQEAKICYTAIAEILYKEDNGERDEDLKIDGEHICLGLGLKGNSKIRKQSFPILTGTREIK